MNEKNVIKKSSVTLSIIFKSTNLQQNRFFAMIPLKCQLLQIFKSNIIKCIFHIVYCIAFKKLHNDFNIKMITIKNIQYFGNCIYIEVLKLTFE